MGHRDVSFVAHKRASECCGCISLHKNEVGSVAVDDLVKFLRDAAAQSERILIGGHQLQIKIDADCKRLEERSEQVRVLARRHINGAHPTGTLFELSNDGGKLDDLRSGAKKSENGLPSTIRRFAWTSRCFLLGHWSNVREPRAGLGALQAFTW